MNTPVRIGMDTSKSVFQLHGVDQDEVVVVRRQFRRAEMIRFFERLPPVLVAIESCGSSHHWARLLGSFGHEVKLIPPQYVKPYVKRGKNDATDAEALCEAVTRPSMRFVPVKSQEQQAACMLMTVRERLVSVKSQLSNAFRSYAAESASSGLREGRTSTLSSSACSRTTICRKWRASSSDFRPGNMLRLKPVSRRSRPD
jgi:transposase